jgi:hypothetical protein
LNASDERGISIVRDKIKNFARQTPRAEAVSSDGKVYPCPPYKIIVLDEADSMTQDAQGALRRIMETYARITRFCLVCNYVTRRAFIFQPILLTVPRADTAPHYSLGSLNHLPRAVPSSASSPLTPLPPSPGCRTSPQRRTLPFPLPSSNPSLLLQMEIFAELSPTSSLLPASLQPHHRRQSSQPTTYKRLRV